MSPVIWNLLLDALVVVLLAGTIFFSARLSLHLKVFRDSRKELESLIGDLSRQIEQAETAINGLRENARSSGRDLQETINEARSLSDELQIMTESANSLAGRLEKLSEKPAARAAAPDNMPARKAPQTSQEKPKSGPAFTIRDPEFSEDFADDMDESGLLPGDYEEDDSGGGQWQSRAEKELYEALKSKKKSDADVI